MILLTGGTTGLPKAVPRTHNDYIASVEYHNRAWEITGEDVVLTVAPVSHAQGMHTGVGSAFFNYARYVLTDSTEARDICKVIERGEGDRAAHSARPRPEAAYRAHSMN